jgi:hypothetical protein
MHLALVILLMGILPIVSIFFETVALQGSTEPFFLVGKWFVFWSVGIRLMLAGFRQVTNPAFTANTIFGVKETAALTIVQELGFGNLSIGLLGTLALFNPYWIIPAAIVAALFYGLAGSRRLFKGERSVLENTTMVSDLFICGVLAGYLATVAWREF